MRYLDITAVAKQSGVAASALRYYEEKGLIRSVGRQGLKRVFDAAVIERLALIALGRAAGFSLDELTGMFTEDGRPKIDRKTLAAKAEELELTIQRLCSMRDGLRHAAACPAPSHLECPSFRRLMRAAAGSRDVGSKVPSTGPSKRTESLARRRKTLASR
jgi:DNA-binding transcriptional MerR regulator